MAEKDKGIPDEKRSNKLRLKPLGIDTHNEHTVYLRADSPVCQAEGFEALARIRVTNGSKTIVASLNILTNGSLLAEDEVSLSRSAIQTLSARPGDQLTLSYLPPIRSMSAVRAKIYGQRLREEQFRSIVDDLVTGNYSNIQTAAFITACAGDRMDIDEIINLTKAMIDTGQKMQWNSREIYDKHCIGGLPGNRTSPIVVAIAAAFGLTIPKTSSRAITSPAGTADTVETITQVNLSLDQMKRVVEKECGCLAWGGNIKLSPADDILIKVERALGIDSEGQLIASVLSKKAAAGSTHVVIDIPVGPTAKIRTREAAEMLRDRMELVGKAIGLRLKILLTDGSQPVGRGIGPALEAMDVLSVLRNEEGAPQDLRDRSLLLAGALLEMSGKVAKGEGFKKSEEILDSGQALNKLISICEAQGHFREPQTGEYKLDVKSEARGSIAEIDNRRIATLAKLAGAPNDPGAGVRLHVSVGSRVRKGQTLFTIYSESQGELDYAWEYYIQEKDMLKIE